MALYYNMCVDCGDDRRMADTIAGHFDGFTIAIPDHRPLECRASVRIERSICFVSVTPPGMGHGTLPESERRPELIADALVTLVRQSLYDELRGHIGFRRAVFGAECCDVLIDSNDAEHDDSIDYRYMIASTELFPALPPGCREEPWGDGYRLVTAASYTTS